MSIDALHIVEIGLPVLDETVMVTRYEPVITVRYSSARIAESCACIMVSKLNPVPFHSVNSPLVEAVRRRRPSGVHRTTLTGCLILFNDECRCFAGMVSAGLVRLATGGSICWVVSADRTERPDGDKHQ